LFYTGFMFKRFCFCVAVPLAVVASSRVNAQDKQPQPPLMTALSAVQQVEAASSKPQRPVSLSKGQLKLGDRLIVPGKRIGPVELGMPLEQVEKMFGLPADTQHLADDSTYCVWRWKTPGTGEPHLLFLGVFCQKQRVVQIETNHPAFALSNGLSVKSSPEQWTEFWGQKPVNYSTVLSTLGPPENATWHSRGFAIQVPGWKFAPDAYPENISVIVLPINHQPLSAWSLGFLKDLNSELPVNPSSSNKTGVESTSAPEKNTGPRIGRPR